MNTTTRISTAERLGRSFGRGWRAYARGERRASSWLVSKGVPVAGATVLLWVVKLAVLGVYCSTSAFWLALLLVCVVAVGWAANQSHSDEEFHLQFPTTLEELRETPGYDPNLYNDTVS
jgi:Flp pilus assembly protein TadB